MLSRSSVPAQAVLAHDRRGDALLSHAAAVRAMSTVAAAPATSTAIAATIGRRRRDGCRSTSVGAAAIVTVGAGHEVAAHATTGKVGGALGHLGLRGGDGRGTLVARALALVAAGDVDHGSGVQGSTRASTDTNANTGAADGLRRA